MSQIEILNQTKLILNLSDEEYDALLCLLIDDTINAVLSYCRIEVLPRQLEGLIPQLVARRFEDRGTEGVKAMTEGERRIEYTRARNVLEEYADRLKPFISKRVYVPSEVTEDIGDE